MVTDYGLRGPTRMRTQSFIRIIATVLWLGSSIPTWAAEITKTASPTREGWDVIVIDGDFALGDEKKFINIALGSENALVVFRSPGGNLIAGIEIGKAIHLKGFSTGVPDGVECASACALAWLGGRVRFMSETARVGFHAVFTDVGVSSAGNALVGAYLNQLALPESAVVYITDTSPENMQWLSFADAQRVGINVEEVKPTTAPSPQPPTSNVVTKRIKDNVSLGYMNLRTGPGQIKP